MAGCGRFGGNGAAGVSLDGFGGGRVARVADRHVLRRARGGTRAVRGAPGKAENGGRPAGRR